MVIETSANSGQPPDLDWRDGGVPVSRHFDDPYFSLDGGLDETRHVFLAGNDLPARLKPHFQVAELGFGTGLNLLALAQVAEVPVRFTSFEAWPMSVAQLEQAHTAFPELADLAADLREALRHGTLFRIGKVMVDLRIGDARALLPDWPFKADAWFLDGFAPSRNPELWSPEMMQLVAKHTTPKGTFATYTAAGSVRQSLADAGFSVERVPGFGRKKHMTKGQLT
jgi:tRNA U34 5-methylaminomethyl-2-thiouridine-forming methyltransferase MnmC